MDIQKIMLHSVRLRIVQKLAARKTMTAAELSEAIADVPRTSLYRHIGVLLDAGILSVVEERRIRGSTERTLALNAGAFVRNNTMDDVPRQALGFLLGLYEKFERYFHRENFAPAGHRVFFNQTVLMADDREFDAFLSELRDLLLKYQGDEAPGRRPRDISVISAPPDVGGTKEEGNKE